MKTEKSSCLIADASESMTSVRGQLLHSLRTNKEYRHAFVEEKIRSGLAAQIKIIREQRGESQTSFARTLNKSQSWVSRLEDPNEAIPTIPTLLIVARAFDVDLEVRFAPFSELLDRLSIQTPESLEVLSFDKEFSVSLSQEEGEAGEAVSVDGSAIEFECLQASHHGEGAGANVVNIEDFRPKTRVGNAAAQVEMGQTGASQEKPLRPSARCLPPDLGIYHAQRMSAWK